MPSLFPSLPTGMPSGFTSGIGSGGSTFSLTSTGGGGKLPDWLPAPDANLKELLEQYQTAPAESHADIATLQKAGAEQQGNVVATAMNAANNAATEYTNRTRQAGGNAAGAGLIRAEGQVKGQMAAGEAKVQMAKDVIDARQKAAGLASQIATNLASIRTDYLKTLANYDVQNRQLQLSGQELDEKKREFNYQLPTGGVYQTNNMGQIGSIFGTPFRDPITGMPSGDPKFASRPNTAPAFMGG